MTQKEFDELPAVIERKEFMWGSGLSQDDVEGMRKAWVRSKDKRKYDLAPANVERLLAKGMLPVWVRKVWGRTARKGKKAYARYYKVVLGVLGKFRL